MRRIRFAPSLALLASVILLGFCSDSQAKTRLPKLPELTAKWWQWVYSIPVSENPLFDQTGEFADNEQPFDHVFFLAGVINESGTAERSITLPAGTALFFPVLNVEADNIDFNTGKLVRGRDALTVKELRAAAKGLEDAATDLHVTLNGVSLLDQVQRVQSPPFAYHLPAVDNIYQFFGIDISGTISPAVSDGYWVYLPPLEPGEYDLNFGGTVPGFSVDIMYHITVEK